MSLIHLYTRVLQLLGKEARLGWILAVANLLLATAQFAEPILFGRIVDVIESDFPRKRTLDIRETPEFLKLAHRVREGLKAGHSYED